MRSSAWLRAWPSPDRKPAAKPSSRPGSTRSSEKIRAGSIPRSEQPLHSFLSDSARAWYWGSTWMSRVPENPSTPSKTTSPPARTRLVRTTARTFATPRPAQSIEAGRTVTVRSTASRTLLSTGAASRTPAAMMTKAAVAMRTR